MKFARSLTTVIFCLLGWAWLTGLSPARAQGLAFTSVTDKTQADQLQAVSWGLITGMNTVPTVDQSNPFGRINFSLFPGPSSGQGGYSSYVYSPTFGTIFPNILRATLTIHYDGPTATFSYTIDTVNHIDPAIDPPRTQYPASGTIPAPYNQFNELSLYLSDWYYPGANTLEVTAPTFSSQGVTVTASNLVIAPGDSGFELNSIGQIIGYKVYKITGFNSLNGFTLTLPCVFTVNSWPSAYVATQVVAIRNFNNPDEVTPPVGSSVPTNIGQITPFSPMVLDNNRISTGLQNIGIKPAVGITPVPVASGWFTTKETQSLHISLSESVPGNLGDLQVELYNSVGSSLTGLLAPSLPRSSNKQAIVYNTTSDVPADTYYVAVRASKTGQKLYSPLVTVSGGDNWGVLTETSSAKAHHVGIYSFPLNSPGTPRINQFPSWLVIHGRESNPFSIDVNTGLSFMFDMEQALAKSATATQQLVVDWSTAASDNASSDFWRNGIWSERWIPLVADFVSKRLRAGNVTGTMLNIAGHSYGSYIAQQIGRNLLSPPVPLASSGKLNRLIALDPAAVGAEFTTDASGKRNASSATYFSDVATSSWAFYGSPLGHLDNACTAAETFVILNPFYVFAPKASLLAALQTYVDPAAISAHDAVPEAFAQLLLSNDPRFALSRTWRTNQINQIGETTGTNEKTETILAQDGGVGVINFVSPKKTPSSTIAARKYPFEGVLRIDNHGKVNPMDVWMPWP